MGADVFYFLSLFHYSILFLLSSHPHPLFYCIISSCSFTPPTRLVHSLPLPPLYLSYFPQTKPCPPLTLCLLSVNSFFLFPVCWPRLTYFSLYLCFSCRSAVSPSVSLVPFPSSLALSGKQKKCLHMCPHKHTHTRIYCTCMYRERHKRTSTPPPKKKQNMHIYTHTHTRKHTQTHTNRASHVTVMKLFQGSNLTEVFNWTDKKVILSFN